MPGTYLPASMTLATMLLSGLTAGCHAKEALCPKARTIGPPG
jgi:hypothetical protein